MGGQPFVLRGLPELRQVGQRRDLQTASASCGEKKRDAVLLLLLRLRAAHDQLPEDARQSLPEVQQRLQAMDSRAPCGGEEGGGRCRRVQRKFQSPGCRTQLLTEVVRAAAFLISL